MISTSRNSTSLDAGCGSKAGLLAKVGSESAESAERLRSGSQELVVELVEVGLVSVGTVVGFEERSCTRWRRIGLSRGKRAGGGRGDAKAVGMQARRGGRRARGFGGEIEVVISIC